MLHFNADVVLSSMTLRWHADHCPSQYSVAVSSDGNAFETVAIIIDSAPEKHVVFDKVRPWTGRRCISSRVHALLIGKSSAGRRRVVHQDLAVLHQGIQYESISVCIAAILNNR